MFEVIPIILAIPLFAYSLFLIAVPVIVVVQLNMIRKAVQGVQK